MAWTWVRPADPSVISGRPLLDLGTGDGQTIAALAPDGFVVGVDRTIELLRPGSVAAGAARLPFKDDSFAVVLAADLFHHLDDDALAGVLSEVRRVLRPDGLLVAWWYERSTDPSPDAPDHARTIADFERVADGFRVEVLEIVSEVTASPTVAVAARPG